MMPELARNFILFFFEPPSIIMVVQKANNLFGLVRKWSCIWPVNLLLDSKMLI